MKLNQSDDDEDEEESFISEYLFIIKSPIISSYIKQLNKCFHTT